MLTDNELKLIKLMSENPDLTNTEAAKKMNIIQSNISTLLSNINFKLLQLEIDLKYLKNYIEITNKDIHFNKIKFLKKKKGGK